MPGTQRKPASEAAITGGRNTIEARGLMKRYGDAVALDGLDLIVPEGTILALLGPNGAGKTTTVPILTTLLKPDGPSHGTAAGAALRSEGVK